MNNSLIECALSSSLNDVISLTEITECSTSIFLDQNGTWNSDKYSLLLLDKRSFELYTDIKDRYRDEMKFDVVGYYNPAINRPADINAVCRVIKEIISHPGVLTFNYIKTLMRLGILIYDGDEKRVQGASYDLVLDKEHLKSGIEIVENKDTIIINPFDYVIVAAQESVNIPKNICATFDLRVRVFCKGIILSNGPQIDPGYAGRLLCLLFNTSSKEYAMEQNVGFEYATIQFQALSRSTEKGYQGNWQRKRRVRDYISQYADTSMAEQLLSIRTINSKYDQLEISLGSFRTELGKVKTKMEGRLLTVLTYLAVVVAFVGLIVAVCTLSITHDSAKDYKAMLESSNNINSRVDALDTKIEQLKNPISSQSPPIKKQRK